MNKVDYNTKRIFIDWIIQLITGEIRKGSYEDKKDLAIEYYNSLDRKQYDKLAQKNKDIPNKIRYIFICCLFAPYRDSITK